MILIIALLSFLQVGDYVATEWSTKEVAESHPIELRISRDKAMNGLGKKSVSVTVSLQNSLIHEMVGFDLRLKYDPRILTSLAIESQNGITINDFTIDSSSISDTANYWFSLNVKGSVKKSLLDSAFILNETQLELLKLFLELKRDHNQSIWESYYWCDMAPFTFEWETVDDNLITLSNDKKSLIAQRYFENKKWFPDGDPFLWYFEEARLPNFIEKPVPENVSRLIDFFNGGIIFYGNCNLAGNGDLNLNEIAFEMLDVMLYARYLVYGDTVFVVNKEGQYSQLDMNFDGISGELTDFFHLIRVVIGESLPHPIKLLNEPVVTILPDTAVFVLSQDQEIVIRPCYLLGAILLEFDGDITLSSLNESDEIIQHFNGEDTKVLIYRPDTGAISRTFEIEGDGQLIEATASSRDGFVVNTKIELE